MLSTRFLAPLALVFVAVCFGAAPVAASPSALRVLVIHTTDPPPSTFQGMIAAQPGVAAVDLFDGNAGTPTPAVVNSYDLVVGMSNGNYQDSATLGNEFADFVDGGGVVFEYAYDNWTGNTVPQGLAVVPQGRWATGSYGVYVPGDNPNDPLTLGTFDVTNPLMQGVTALASSDNTSPTLAAAATSVAKWSNGVEMIAYKGRVVGSSANLDENASPSGDWGRLTINAVRWLGRHTLSVSRTGTGAGTVTSAPGGIDCGATCASDYPYITAVTLTAKPTDANNGFSGWSGDCSGTATTCTVSVDRARNVTAAFATIGAAAKFKLASRTVSISLRNGTGRLGLRCDNLPTDTCRFALTLSASVKSGRSGAAKMRRVGAGKGTIAGGKRGKVKLKLTKRGLALLKKAKTRKLKVQLGGRSTNNAGQVTKVKTRVTLKAKRR